MKLNKANADIFVPDGADVATALKRTTHMGIGAHQDDLEFIASPGIIECFGRKDKWFTGITCTDGAGSARTGVYADYTDEDMKAVRMQEQRVAASVGRYSAIVQIGYSSKEAKDAADSRMENDLFECLNATKPRVVYTHNPADKHATHVAVCMAAINALRRLPKAERPAKVYGAEVWRSLDWMPDASKAVLDVSGHESLLTALFGVFDSQIGGGKRYDLASQGRLRANATYLESHGVDTATASMYAMDLTPLIENEKLSVSEYTLGFVDIFANDVREKLGKHARR